MAKKPPMTIEERLADAEARADVWKRESSRLANELFEARQNADIAAGKHAAELKQVTDAGNAWKAACEKAKAEAIVEGNGLRSAIRDLELTVERHRGFHDGIREAQPPRMVPEERPTVRNEWPYPSNEVRLAVNGYGDSRAKPWWHK